MDDTAKRRAEELTEKAISEASLEDFRAVYRDRLRWLKDNKSAAFTRALAYYNDILVANVENGGNAIMEWVEYGRQLGDLTAAGKVVRIDETGRARPYETEAAKPAKSANLANLDGLILHLPDDTNVPALALAVPRQLSDAQKATLQLLVRAPVS